MKATLIALSAAVALAAGSTAALAAKKHHGGGGPGMDPRAEYAMKAKGGSQTWCSIDPSCNGWNKYWDGLKGHKKYAPPGIVVGKV